MLINIIHPYTYKFVREEGSICLSIGPCPEYEARDEKVAQFVETALDAHSNVLLHKIHNGDSIKYFMQDLALEADPLYHFVKDARIDRVTTSPGGIPIPDQRIDGLDDKTWEFIAKTYTSHSQLQEMIHGKKIILFIGGILENCVANAMHYFHTHYNQGQQFFYVPELCVSLDSVEQRRVITMLEDKVVPLSYTDAMQLVSYEKI